MARGNGETTRRAVGHSSVNGKRADPIQCAGGRRPSLARQFGQSTDRTRNSILTNLVNPWRQKCVCFSAKLANFVRKDVIFNCWSCHYRFEFESVTN